MGKEKKRQSSGSTTTTNATVTATTGVTTVDSAEVACGCPVPGPETIQVEQVLGAEMAQRVVEFDMFVPPQKPDIEQVVDVYVKEVEIKTIDIVPDKVIVRGELEVKVMYVADLPNQPVHAFERKNIRFTRDIEIPGAEPDMKATGDVTVEFVDYDFNEDEPRQVHITIVLKIWARVTTTTDMDVYALTPVDEIGVTEQITASASSGDIASASAQSDTVSASQTGGGKFEGWGVENLLVTGPMTPTAGTASTTMPVNGTVTGNSVNVRTGPGTNFPVVTKVNKGTVVSVREQAFGWYRVVLPDATTGWIASWLVSVAGTLPPTPMG